MAMLKNSKHEKFCQLVAKGESLTAAYASAGYAFESARNNAPRLMAKDVIRNRVLELQERVSESLVAQSIAVKEARIRAVNDRWLKMQQVIEERAKDPGLQLVAGGKTGLLAHDQKSIGGGPLAEKIDVYEVDTGLLKELREHEVQAAKELGQWIEKGELTGNIGPLSLIIEGAQNAEWLNPEKSD
jgi:hypothetical protein